MSQNRNLGRFIFFDACAIKYFFSSKKYERITEICIVNFLWDRGVYLPTPSCRTVRQLLTETFSTYYSLKHHPEVELSLTHTISTETHCNDEPSQRYKSRTGSNRMVMKNNILDYSTLNILLQDMYTRIRFGLT